MPLYEYQCEACNNRFERIQKFSDPLVDTCPSCGGTVRKLLSSPAIQFKGTGWYITDYAKKSSTDSGSSRDVRDAKDAKEAKDAKDAKDTKDSGKKETSSTSDSSSTSTSTTPSQTKKND